MVCVAQCRPNTAPTVLLADAVGHHRRGRRNAAGDRRFPVRGHRQRGRSGPGVVAAPDGPERRGRAGPVRQRGGGGADPPDRAGVRRGSPARWSAPTSTVPAICCTCCPRAPSPTSVTWRCRGPVRASATDSSASTWTVSSRSPAPTRCRRITGWGSAADLEGHNLVTVTRPLISDPFEAQELADHVRDSLAGGCEHAHGGRRRRRGGAAAHAAAGGARRRRRRGGADPRRHRGEAPRPRAAVQGRDDPRDPPPGEEQPADRGRAAAPAGAAHQQRRRPRGADRVGAPGVVDRVGPRRAVDVGGRGGQPRRGHRPHPADHERRRVGGRARSGSTGSATSVCSTPTGRRR